MNLVKNAMQLSDSGSITANDGHKKRGLATTFKLPTSFTAMFFIAC